VNAVIGLLMALATATPTVATKKAPEGLETPALSRPATKASDAHVERVPVFLQFSAEDAVGAAYVRKLRDALEASTTYRPVTRVADAQFLIGIVTMDPTEGESGAGAGRSTVAAVTLQLENAKGLNAFIYSWVLVANRDKVEAIAADLFAAIDKEIRELPSDVLRAR